MSTVQEYLNSVQKKAAASPAMTYLSSLQKPKVTTPAVSSNPSSTTPAPVTPALPKTTTPTTTAPSVAPSSSGSFSSSFNSLTPEQKAAYSASNPNVDTTTGLPRTSVTTTTTPPPAPTATGTPAVGSPPPVSTPLSKYLEQYKINKTALSDANKPSSAISTASQSLADINSNITKKQLETRRTVDADLDRSEGTVAGARQIAALDSRRGNSELADLSVQQNAAANTLQALTGDRDSQIKYAQSLIDSGKAIVIGDSLIDPNTGEVIYQSPKDAQAGFTLSPGESRYDASGKLIASGGAKPLTATQEQKQIDDAKAQTASQQSATQSLSLVNDLLAGCTDAITGIGQNPLNLVPEWLGGPLANSESINKYNQLTGLLKLGQRGLLKGQGQISDYEGKILAQASSALGRNLPNAEFKQSLKDIAGVIKTNNGQATTVTVTNPSTGESLQADLTGPEIYKLVSEGNTIKYQ